MREGRLTLSFALGMTPRDDHIWLRRQSRATLHLPLSCFSDKHVRLGLRMSQEEVRYGSGVKIRRKDRGTAGPPDDTRLPGRCSR